MDPGANPFSPGAGTQPPELAGREGILGEAEVALERVRRGVSTRSAIFVGLRGVGKTVLLTRVREIAEGKGFLTIPIEAHENKRLPVLLIPHLRKLLLQLNRAEKVNDRARRALRVLRSFAMQFRSKVSFGGLELELGVEPERGIADSGDLEHDLGELMVVVAEAAKAQGEQVCLLIDELQYINEEEMSALIMALHQVAQLNLPLILYAAGLPLILGLAGKSKSYSERLFAFPRIDVLDPAAAVRALERPVEALGVSFTPDALADILQTTRRYPYFLQQWGYESWNLSRGTPITADVARETTIRAIAQLDDSFFRVRFDRLTRREKEFMFAMVDLGGDVQRTGDIAERLGVKATSIGPLRGSLIRKGMIFSPAHGDNAFTVPLFDGFLRRQMR